MTMKANDIRYTVGDVAQTAHMSVRALHHYDELELLRPSRRTEAGYRLYTSDDLERLQQVLFYKELGFSLAEIREIMADPTYDRREALLAQRREVAAWALRVEPGPALRGLLSPRTLEVLPLPQPRNSSVHHGEGVTEPTGSGSQTAFRNEDGVYSSICGDSAKSVISFGPLKVINPVRCQMATFSTVMSE